MTALFAATIFLSAMLTFLVQPMMGKQLLPLVGGTPGVWNGCLLFFQSMLLLGYLLANLVSRFNSLWFFVIAGVAFLSLGCFGWATTFAALRPIDSEYPAWGVLKWLLVTVGVPYTSLCITSPLLQSWYARSDRNPYPLFAASNFGSFAGLIAYPLVIEPFIEISMQNFWWLECTLVWVIMMCVLAVRVRNLTPSMPQTTLAPLPTKRILKWVALAALTSSFLMSVSTHLTTDIAPVPLLWVIPLSLYLLSFVIVFSRWTNNARLLLGRVTPMFLCFLAVAILTRANEPMILVAMVHLAAFFAVALLCHGELAADKPDANQLTQFYLWLSVGGVVGGLFNTFIAPFVFSSLGNVEYPLAMILAGLVRPPSDAVGIVRKRADGIWPLALGAFTGLLVFGIPMVAGTPKADNPADELLDRVIRGGLSFGVPSAIAFALVWRPVRFALCLGAVVLVGSFAPSRHGKTLEISRNFFGTLRVTRTDDGQFTRIVHGTTLHGQQKAGEGRPVPTTYYHPTGPLGSVFAGLPDERRKTVGVVGLGAGGAAAYAKAGETWTFFEIDPAVIRIAKDSRYFTYLSTCPTNYEIVVGDARRQLQMRTEQPKYDVLVLDAFNSDSVPVHLLTIEAMRLYLERLNERGVIAFHVSNRYLDLAALVARVAWAVDPTLVVRWDDDRLVSDGMKAEGKTESTWLVVTRNSDDLPTMPNGRPNARWQPITVSEGPIWRDDFSNLLGVWRRGTD